MKNDLEFFITCFGEGSLVAFQTCFVLQICQRKLHHVTRSALHESIPQTHSPYRQAHDQNFLLSISAHLCEKSCSNMCTWSMAKKRLQSHNALDQPCGLWKGGIVRGIPNKCKRDKKWKVCCGKFSFFRFVWAAVFCHSYRSVAEDALADSRTSSTKKITRPSVVKKKPGVFGEKNVVSPKNSMLSDALFLKPTIPLGDAPNLEDYF